MYAGSEKSNPSQRICTENKTKFRIRFFSFEIKVSYIDKCKVDEVDVERFWW